MLFFSRAFYFVLGFLFFIGALTAKALWSDNVVSGQQLTQTLWNDLVNKIVTIDSRVSSVETGKAVFGAPDVLVYSGTPLAATFQAGTNFNTIDLSPWVGAKKALVYLSISPPAAATTCTFRPAGTAKPVGYNADNWAGWGSSAVVVSGTETGYVTAMTDSSGRVEMMASPVLVDVRLLSYITN